LNVEGPLLHVIGGVAALPEEPGLKRRADHVLMKILLNNVSKHL
jgi:hypothetical protein